MKPQVVLLIALALWPPAAGAGEADPELADLVKRVEALEKTIANRPLSLGIVSESEVLDNLEEKKELDVDIELREKEARKILKEKQKECLNLETEIELHAEGSKKRVAKMTELKTKKRELALKYKQLTADIQQEAKKRFNEIRMKIREEIALYARRHGYALVIEKDALLFGEEGKILTTEIIDQMNTPYFEATRTKLNNEEKKSPEP